MTVTVSVKARAHGAQLTVNGEKHEILPNHEAKFHTDDQTALTIEVTEPAEAPVEEVLEEAEPPTASEEAELAQQAPAEAAKTEEEKPATGFGKKKGFLDGED